MRKRLLRGFLAAVVVSGCNPQSDGICPKDLPATCVMPAPSWSKDINPIFVRACVSCHGPDGGQQNKPFTTWFEVAARRSMVLSQVYGCRMPEPDSGITLTSDERATLLHWLVCGAPQN